ncbi:MAG: hypothetical protein KDA37_11680, partial [Planctomycetales bacterium]|nr:hypothetical protein [Planctomycetales bacterium]
MNSPSQAAMPRGVAWLFVLPFLLPTPGHCQTSAGALPAELKAAKVDLAKPTPEQIELARSDYVTRLVRLERALRPGTTKCEKWKKHLRWEALSDFAEGKPG